MLWGGVLRDGAWHEGFAVAGGGWLVAGVPVLALHSEGPGKRLTLWVGCGMLGKKEGPAPGSSPQCYAIKPSQSVRGLVAAFFYSLSLKYERAAITVPATVATQVTKPTTNSAVIRKPPFIPVFRPRPVEFGRQPPEGVRAFQWLQYSMVYLCCEVGMACFGWGSSGWSCGRRGLAGT